MTDAEIGQLAITWFRACANNYLVQTEQAFDSYASAVAYEALVAACKERLKADE